MTTKILFEGKFSATLENQQRLISVIGKVYQEDGQTFCTYRTSKDAESYELPVKNWTSIGTDTWK